MADPAEHAQAQIDVWHARLAAGGTPRPSPTIATAIAAQYERVVAYCAGCRTTSHVPFGLIRRPAETPLADLAGRLTCSRCGKGGPLPRVEGVSRQRDAPGYMRTYERR